MDEMSLLRNVILPCAVLFSTQGSLWVMWRLVGAFPWRWVSGRGVCRGESLCYQGKEGAEQGRVRQGRAGLGWAGLGGVSCYLMSGSVGLLSTPYDIIR